MTLSALIRKRDTGNLATAIPAISATQPKGDAATVARIATVAVANPKEEKTAPPAKVSPGDTVPDPMTPADVRIEKVIDKLHGDPRLRYAMEVCDDVDLESVILTLAIRDKAAYEIRIPKSRYDAFALLELIEKHTTPVTVQ
jgi:hypothetical protein